MKRKNILLAALLLLTGNTALMAQNDNDDETVTVTNAKGEEEEIDVPESMTYEIDSLLSLYNSKTYLHADTTNHMRDVNPVFDTDVYKSRLKRMPTIIEMPYNDVVQKFIDLYSGRRRRSVSFMLGASNFYMPIFEQALETYDMPLELKYLPVIESGLNPKAVSRVGATGLWQFMLATGKRYGLKVNSLVDERRDPVKASYAAARYLKDLYKIFGDWNLVIAAYNCGPDKINKAIHRANSKDYWQIYPYLPEETRGYVPAFIAANYIMTYYCDHNIAPMITDLPVKTDTVLVNRDVHFQQVAQVLGLDIDQIRELNPQYRRDIVNGSSEPSDLRLPCDYINAFIDKQDSIFNFRDDELLSKRATVAVNDDEPSYKRYSSSRHSSSRSSHNNSTSSRKNSKKSKKNKKNNSGKNITIRQGDTLSEIAHRNGTTVKKLKQLNNISGSNIRAGKKLRVK